MFFSVGLVSGVTVPAMSGQAAAVRGRGAGGDAQEGAYWMVVAVTGVKPVALRVARTGRRGCVGGRDYRG